MHRRSFIRAGLAGGAGLVLGAGRLGAAGKSRVHLVRNDAVFIDDVTLDQRTVRAMLASLLMSLTGSGSVAAAWRMLFTAGDVVGIKINTINGPLTSYNRQLVMGVVEELLGIGIPAQNIIVFDRTGKDLVRGGFTLASSGAGFRCYGSAEAGYEELPENLDGAGVRLTRIVTRECTALINMPVLRAHGAAGMTFAIKNMMGAIDHPEKLHPGNVYRAADLYAVPAVVDKVRLVIGDALWPIYQDATSPAEFRIRQNSLLASLDPVAMDAAGTDMLLRIRKGVKKRKWPLVPAVKTTGRGRVLGLGTPAYALITEKKGGNLP